MTDNLKDPQTVEPVSDITPATNAAEGDPQKTISPLETIPVSEEQFLESAPEVLADETHGEELTETETETDTIDFQAHAIDELVKMLEQYVVETEVPRFKAKIAGIREFLSNHFQTERQSALDKFTEEGSNKDDFQPVPDALEERFQQAIRTFHKKRIEYNERLEKQRIGNLEQKNQILTQLKDLIQNEENMGKAFDRFHELLANWRSVGPVPGAQVKDLQLTYKFLIDKFYDFIKINRELQELDQRRNLEAKLNLCEQADDLLLESSINVALRKLHQLQDKWRETGPVSREKKNEIWDRFKTTCDKLFERRRNFIAEADTKRTANLAAKTALCEQVENIKQEDHWKHREWQEATEKIGAIQAEWKKIGPADKKVNDEIWHRFKTVCDAFYKAKNEFYHKRKQEFASNLQLKTELCIQAEGLRDNNDWKTTTAELIRLQQEWKKIGPVGERQSDKIWKRFRTACDAFFTNKSNHFSNLDKSHEENLQKKIELITVIENFVPGVDSHASFEELKNFQRQWSDMGMVPLNKKEEINSRYKAAIDAQFDKLKISSSDRQKMRYQNKLDHIRHTGNAGKMDDERRSLLHRIQALKNDVQVWENNIGFFAKSKNAEKLKNEFEEKINLAKEEIKTLTSKLEMTKGA